MFYESIFNNGSGAFRETGALRFPFYPEGRTYSPPALRVVVWPAANARSPRGMRLLREPTANAAETAVPVIIVCAKGPVRRSLRLRKPATGSFVAVAGRLKNDRPAFSLPQRETEKENRGGENDWQSIIWKRRSSAEAQAVPLAQPRPI